MVGAAVVVVVVTKSSAMTVTNIADASAIM
jgi:hypothetical protein